MGGCWMCSSSESQAATDELRSLVEDLFDINLIMTSQQALFVCTECQLNIARIHAAMDLKGKMFNYLTNIIEGLCPAEGSAILEFSIAEDESVANPSSSCSEYSDSSWINEDRVANHMVSSPIIFKHSARQQYLEGTQGDAPESAVNRIDLSPILKCASTGEGVMFSTMFEDTIAFDEDSQSFSLDQPSAATIADGPIEREQVTVTNGHENSSAMLQTGMQSNFSGMSVGMNPLGEHPSLSKDGAPLMPAAAATIATEDTPDSSKPQGLKQCASTRSLGDGIQACPYCGFEFANKSSSYLSHVMHCEKKEDDSNGDDSDHTDEEGYSDDSDDRTHRNEKALYDCFKCKKKYIPDGCYIKHSVACKNPATCQPNNTCQGCRKTCKCTGCLKKRRCSYSGRSGRGCAVNTTATSGSFEKVKAPAAAAADVGPAV